MSLGDCGLWRIEFSDDLTSFTAAKGRGVMPSSSGSLVPETSNEPAALPVDAHDASSVISSFTAADKPVVTRLIGTGPWAWQGVAPFAFLAEGALHTPWGAGKWGPHPTLANTILANFVSEKHVVTFDECWSFTSKRVRDGDRAGGGALLSAAAKECPELGTSA